MLLRATDIDIAYQTKQVVFGASLEVDEGQFVSLIGHNGAGKTTLLKTICGFLKPGAGRVSFHGTDITGRSPSLNVRQGLAFVHQEKSIFPNLSVIENLTICAQALDLAADLDRRLDKVYDLFPILRERSKQRANTLSGGQQKQLAIGMAILIEPKLLLLDEPTLGLSPNLVKELGAVLRRIQEMGAAVLLVEQNVGMAISLAQKIYVMRTGQIILEETHEAMARRDSLWDLF